MRRVSLETAHRFLRRFGTFKGVEEVGVEEVGDDRSRTAVAFLLDVLSEILEQACLAGDKHALGLTLAMYLQKDEPLPDWVAREFKRATIEAEALTWDAILGECPLSEASYERLVAFDVAKRIATAKISDKVAVIAAAIRKSKGTAKSRLYSKDVKEMSRGLQAARDLGLDLEYSQWRDMAYEMLADQDVSNKVAEILESRHPRVSNKVPEFLESTKNPDK